jgi:hypothetical protein
MDLLEAVLTLAREVGKREVMRKHVYAAVTRLVLFLVDVMKPGDRVTHQDRTYEIRRVDLLPHGRGYTVVVDNGRGPAILGDRLTTIPFLPHASYEEHIFFAEAAADILTKFGELVRQDVSRSESAHHEAISESEHAERIVNL